MPGSLTWVILSSQEPQEVSIINILNFTDEETEAYRDQEIHPRANIQKVINLGLNLSLSPSLNLSFSLALLDKKVSILNHLAYFNILFYHFYATKPQISKSMSFNVENGDGNGIYCIDCFEGYRAEELTYSKCYI